jgi:2-haloacid dehalogenase
MQLTGPIEAVVFDIGGVLLDWNPRYLYRKLLDDEREMERFLSEICTLEWHEAHDRGTPFEVSCGKLAELHPEYSELIHAWGQRSEEMVAGPIPGGVEVLRELKAAGVPCYALTNMEVETYPKRVERFPFLTWFDGAVVSGFEGVVKPEPEIFERLLERFDLTPETTLFVDDSPRNVDAARELGIQAVEFSTAAELRRLLSEAGLLRAAA